MLDCAPRLPAIYAGCPSVQGQQLHLRCTHLLLFRYITSMYWAYTTMTTVGYGDISSVTIAEKV